MVTVYPFEEDWSFIQALTGDSSWAPSNMRNYFQRLERNEYLTNFKGSMAAGHGFDGWLGTDEMHLDLMLNDPQTLSMLRATNIVMNGSSAANITDTANLKAIFSIDMNTAYSSRDSTQALYRIPMAVSDSA